MQVSDNSCGYVKAPVRYTDHARVRRPFCSHGDGVQRDSARKRCGEKSVLPGSPEVVRALMLNQQQQF